MEKTVAEMMFNYLSSRIGSMVSCKAWSFGEAKIYNGILENVIPFDCVTIDGNIIPFVGRGQAIEDITLLEKGKSIYANPGAVGYQGFSEKDMMGVALAQREMLGHSIILDGIQNPSEQRKR